MNRSRISACALAAALALTGACGDAASIDVLGTGTTRHTIVELSGPRSGLGMWRYYDGVRLLECDVQVEAWAEGGSSGAAAEWLDGAVDLYDLRTGEYLGTDYLYPSELEYLWGAREIENGERIYARPLRYTSYGPFRAYVSFRYDSGGEPREAAHRFDCR